MNLREEILKEHSKAQCTKIVKWVGSSRQRFDELFSLFLNDDHRIVQRAAWPVSYCVIDHPALINKNWKKLLDKLKQPANHNAVKRNGVRLMQHIALPKKYHGEIMDTCFKFLASPTESLAVKVFSMTVLAALAKEYPEIKNELKLLIEDQLPGQTVAFKNRGKKIIKELDKL